MGRWLAWLAAIAAFALPAAARAQDAPLLPHPVLASADMRESLDLSGPWTWSIDPYRDGLGGFHGEPAGEGHRRWDDRDPEEVARQNPAALFEYDMRHSPTTLLPSSWITQDPSLRYYDKLVWYQRAFTVRRQPGGRAFLRFGAVDYVAYVYLNGHFVGRHEGGFTPFAFEVTEPASRRREPDHDRRRCRARRRDGAADGDRLGDLWRRHPAGIADPDAANLCRRRLAAPHPRRPHRRDRPSRRPATRPAAPVRVEIAGASFRHDRRHRRRRQLDRERAGAARPAPLVAGKPDALRRPFRRRRGRAARPDRPAHDRGARRGHPPQRPADLPARHLPARGGTGRESEPDDHARRRPRLAHRGAGRPPRQFRPARPLSAQRGDDADGRRAGPARLERDPGLLAGRFRPARDARHWRGACSPRISRATATAPRSSCGASATKRRRARRGSLSCARWSATSARSTTAGWSPRPCSAGARAMSRRSTIR